MSNTTSLTRTQNRVLKFLKSFQGSRGYCASTREIADHFGFASQTAAMNHLRALEKKGAIKRAAGIARAITIL